MKKILLLALFIPVFVYAENIVTSKITDVTVYQQGARVTNEAVIALKPGNNEIIITDITSSINANSVQARLVGNAILLSATTRVRKKEDAELPLRTKSLKDSILLVENEIDWLNQQVTVYEGEATLITENQKLGTTEEKATVEEIVRLSEFYRTRQLDIRKKIYKLKIDLREKDLLKKDLNYKLNALRHKEKKNVGEIVLNISSKTTSKVTAKISYLTYQAGWTPLYDVRAGDADKPINLLYKANVYQTSGYAWQDVNLSISTGNPAADNNRPTMYPWYIDFFQPAPPVVGYGMDKKKEMMVSNSLQRSMAMEEEASLDEVVTIGYGVVKKENSVATEYEIDVAQDIPSDGKQHLVAIKNYELDSKYSYHAIPKLNKSTFLIAKVADYGEYNLLPGQANLFYEGMYIGQSYINPVTTTDSLLLSLGRDEKVIVKRNQLTDLMSRQSLGNNIRETKAFEIIVRNNNNYSIELDLMDQVPIAQNDDIEVKIEELNGAKYDQAYGSLLWKLNIKAGESKTVKFVYSVKYPKDKTIPNL